MYVNSIFISEGQMRQPIQVLTHVVRRRTDRSWEYLMLLRPPERGAFWQGASGGVEDDEDIVAAARREMLEETGLAPQTIEKVDFSYCFPLVDEWRNLFSPGTRTITEYVFLAKVD
jgi:8-oxo-dGTP pyrophosphatase MutT (NUDIX family)